MYHVFYIPRHKCLPGTWLFFFGHCCGRRAFRICGWHFYPKFN